MAHPIHYDDILHIASSAWYLGNQNLSIAYPLDISYVEVEEDDEELHEATSVVFAYGENDDGTSTTDGTSMELSGSLRAVWADDLSSDSDSDSDYSGSRREHVSDVTTISVSTGGDFPINDLVTQHSELTFDVSFHSTVSERDFGSMAELAGFQTWENMFLVPGLVLTGATDVHLEDEDLGCNHAISGVVCHCLTARNLSAVQEILKDLRRAEGRELRRHEAAEWPHPRSQPDRRSEQAWGDLTVDLRFE
ncbi:hypothetical protein QBC32DRAFT_267980 [Pseudoneurospora amorphoporcata]|uniref:Uncharacterized protein n=1 Tax=Pseudoneurospora amorphoporcata TaxID=241081 RepID=A0AAN6NN01_9PEZI|nr:hypothetical protein QBC32DRAFT_267980 [Pseudoneurospora amorphoporcata]